ncbi:hypothetical protein BD414DRAFT_59970 [Trametes punicea]|nr:hypothetical protein BD414DRAFT_59970 [Trametes punicea]
MEDPSEYHKHFPSLLTLNDDVLLHLSTFLAIDDLGCLLRTCRRLYSELIIQEMLKRHVELWPQDLDSFLSFLHHVLRENYTPPSAWNLSVTFHSRQSHHCEKYERCAEYECRFKDVPIRGSGLRLTKILESSRGLSGITMTGAIAVAFSPDELHAALASVPHLQRLTLRPHKVSTFREHVKALVGILPELRVLQLKFGEWMRLPHRDHPSGTATAFALRLLTLEELEVHTFLLTHDGVQLPRMRKLKTIALVLGMGASSWAVAFTRTFPNLTHLECQAVYAASWEGERIREVHYQRLPQRMPDLTGNAALGSLIRRWRAEDQSLRDGPNSQGSPPGLSLQYVRVISLVDLYYLALPCAHPVTLLDIGMMCPRITPEATRAVLSMMCPRCLIFSLMLSLTGPGAEAVAVLQNLFGAVDLMPFLTHLIFDMSLGLLRSEETMVAFGQALQSSSVTHLLVRVYQPAAYANFDFIHDGSPDDFVTEVYDSAHGLLRALSENIPSLLCVLLEADGELHGWRRADAYSNHWRELSEVDSRRILAIENMRCPRLAQPAIRPFWYILDSEIELGR